MRALKIITLILLFLLVKITANGQDKPTKQTVYSIVKQQKPKDWYGIQAELWKKHIETHLDDTEAWLNYYTARRMMKLYGLGVTQEDLNDLVDEMEKAIPESFEYHYVANWNFGVGNPEDGYSHLQKAYQIAPDRVELFDDLLLHYEVTRDMVRAREMAIKWFNSNDMASGLYAWSYNTLIGLEPNAILITSGDNDTYPALVLQYAKDIRSDVSVLNNSLLGLNKYRASYFKELGIPPMTTSYDDYETYEKHQQAIIQHIKKYSYRPLYFAASARTFLYEPFKDEVYNVGLTSKWSSEKFDNIAVIKKNFEKNYLTDYLTIDLDNHISNGVVHHINSNYLIPMITLYNHYIESEDPKSEALLKVINTIADKGNRRTEVDAILQNTKTYQNNLVDLNIRQIENYVEKVNDSLYAGTTEVSNEMYELFLTDLLKQKRYADLEIAKAVGVDWRSLLPEQLKKLPNDSIFPNGHPNDALAPVVNISYEGAKMYCEWLTLIYNQSDQKKKKYELVEFRLPTEKEWEYIASSGKSNIKYSWQGDYLKNSKGCYLSNLNYEEPKSPSQCSISGVDGAYFTVRVDSYFPNSFGLYNVTGNVAEMVLERGKSKGGGWNTKPSKAVFSDYQVYTEPSAEIGFRIIMIVK